jgi:hypothetical protein
MRQRFIGLLLFAALFTIPAHADPLTVTFISSSLTGSPGETLIFSGFLTNTGASDVYLNGAGINLAGFDVSAIDLTDFLVLDWPVTPLAAGASTDAFDFFSVTIPSGFDSGIYYGSLDVQGGATLDDDDVLGSAAFKVGVEEVSSTPEPGGLSLLGIGSLTLFGFLWLHRRNGTNWAPFR